MNSYTKEEIDNKHALCDMRIEQTILLTQKQFQDIIDEMFKLNERIKSLEAMAHLLKRDN